MTKINDPYHFAYVADNALWMFRGFLDPIQHVIRRIPADVLSEIADADKGFKYSRIHPEEIATVPSDEWVVSQPPVFIAPDPAFLGLVLDDKSIDGEGFLVYLSPELLERPPAEMEAIIAVQFAHVLLRQCGYLSDRLAELCETSTAQGLAESWGFQVPPTFDWDASFAENDTGCIGSEDSDVGELLRTVSLLWVGSEYRGYFGNVFSRLPKNVLDRLRELKPVFFAPERGLLARTMPAPNIDDFRLRVYLSPKRLRDTPCQIENTVAHELAHVYCEHPEFSDGDARKVGEEQEREADVLAAEWGFPS